MLSYGIESLFLNNKTKVSLKKIYFKGKNLYLFDINTHIHIAYFPHARGKTFKVGNKK